jgi:hypothetical protein
VQITQAQEALAKQTGEIHGAALAGSAFGAANALRVVMVDVRGEVKNHIAQTLTARLVTHPAFAGMTKEAVSNFVQSKLDRWAETSGDSDIPATRMQYAVKDEFGLTDAGMGHLDAFVVGYEKEDAQNRAFVRAEYDRTQKWFKEHGITHLSVFRGMSDDDDELGYGFETVTMQPASSWTTDLDNTAYQFATMREGRHPKILTTRVPVSEVLSTCVTGRGCLSEQEFLLLGKPTRAHVFGMVSGSDPDDELSEFTIDQEATIKKIRKSLVRANWEPA